MNNIEILIKLIKESKKTVFFGGAGVSVESGLQDFRSKNGIYNEKWNYKPEVILSHSFFYKNQSYFYLFYREKLNSLKYKPNIVHKTLKKMEDKKLLSSVITQNIDGFDKIVGIKNVIELHGSIYRNYCPKCKKSYSAEFIFNSEALPICTCGEIIKPDVVLYQEELNEKDIENAINEISTCDLLIIGGTSLAVYPAASFVNYFKGKHIVLINKSITPYDYKADIIIHDSIGKVFEEINKNI